MSVKGGYPAAMEWRIALIDSGVSSVDIQTYLWYPDHSVRFILERAVKAAKRGFAPTILQKNKSTNRIDTLLAAVMAVYEITEASSVVEFHVEALIG